MSGRNKFYMSIFTNSKNARVGKEPRHSVVQTLMLQVKPMFRGV